MGGRTEREKRHEFAERELWIQQVSESRLSAYERMLDSGGKVVRIDETARSRDQQGYFRDLIKRERNRREGKT